MGWPQPIPCCLVVIAHLNTTPKQCVVLTIAYTCPLLEPLATRREVLEAFGFTCTCQRCLLEASLPAFVTQGLQQVKLEMEKPGGTSHTGCLPSCMLLLCGCCLASVPLSNADHGTDSKTRRDVDLCHSLCHMLALIIAGDILHTVSMLY